MSICIDSESNELTTTDNLRLQREEKKRRTAIEKIDKQIHEDAMKWRVQEDAKKVKAQELSNSSQSDYCI